MYNFRSYSRREILKEYKNLRYVRANQTYFLYFIYTSEMCMYIGETSNIFWRIIKHKAKCTTASIIYLQEYSNKEEVLRLEKHYIQVLKPIFNNRYCALHQLELF